MRFPRRWRGFIRVASGRSRRHPGNASPSGATPAGLSRAVLRLYLLSLVWVGGVAVALPITVLRGYDGQFLQVGANLGVLAVLGGIVGYGWWRGGVSGRGAVVFTTTATAAVVALMYVRGEPGMAFWVYPLLVVNAFLLPHALGLLLNLVLLAIALPLIARFPDAQGVALGASATLVALVAFVVTRTTTRWYRALEKTEAGLRESENLRARAESLAAMGSWAWDVTNDRFEPSREWCRLTGTWGQRLTRTQVERHVHPDDLPEVRRRMEWSLETGGVFDAEHRIVRLDDGAQRWVRAHAGLPVRTGDRLMMYGFTQDITDQKRTERALREKSRHLRERVKELECLRQLSDIQEGLTGRLEDAAPEIVRLIPPAWQYPERTVARLELEGRVFLSEGFRETPYRLEQDIRVRGDRVGGLTVCLLEAPDAAPAFLDEERHLLRLISHRLGAVADRQRVERELHRMVFEDRLTGLPSRQGFLQWLASLLERERGGDKTYFVLVNLRHLNDVNQAHGFEVGDALLAAVARRLDTALYNDEKVARLDGDQFGLLLRGEHHELADPATVARWLEDLFSTPFRVAGRFLQVELTAGIVHLDVDCRGVQEVFRRGQLALHAAREDSEQAWVSFTPSLDAAARERIQITEALRSALAGEQFELRFQPQVRLSDRRVVSLEALLRWRHPTLGLLMPGQFIGAAERSQLILPIGNWVLRRACHQLRVWQDAGMEPPVVAVNVSMVQFLRSNVAGTLRDLLDEYGVPGNLLTVEITESLFEREPEVLRRQIDALHALGVRVALDDFGTGYSSLGHLHDYAFDQIKIDRHFVQSCVDQPYSREIVRMIVRIAETLDCEVVAEGLETARELALMRELGCGVGQGFYFSPPLTVDEVPEAVRRTLPVRARLHAGNVGESP